MAEIAINWAACPLDAATAAMPPGVVVAIIQGWNQLDHDDDDKMKSLPSNAAILFSKTSTVGFIIRE